MCVADVFGSVGNFRNHTSLNTASILFLEKEQLFYIRNAGGPPPRSRKLQVFWAQMCRKNAYIHIKKNYRYFGQKSAKKMHFFTSGKMKVFQTEIIQRICRFFTFKKTAGSLHSEKVFC